MRYLMKPLVALAVLAGFGCATSGARSDAPQPTHRWIAVEDVSRAKYKLDNNICIEQSAVEFQSRHAERDGEAVSDGDAPSGSEAEGRYLHKGQPEFARYERCMNQRGYNLASY